MAANLSRPQCVNTRMITPSASDLTITVTSRLFAQPFVRAQIKESIKTPRHWPLWEESTDDQWIPFLRASNAENVFPELKCINFDEDFTELCSQGFN